eukprot:CAMPEP_0171608130 /NCGR_PEP_ID=MMETSP0990-20121206/8740_1 /TAXON_ID=483369 /ORGANISM="non described non described, Strain CCMP2098" /LENGTH=61 /DNA_ID=CAMNT_0012171229 /DNA_START=319 /DNA_END=504 /DNA_ORIENTATION=+
MADRSSAASCGKCEDGESQAEPHQPAYSWPRQPPLRHLSLRRSANEEHRKTLHPEDRGTLN